MANRRMISKTVCETAQFLNMSFAARALYSHLVLGADDEGVVQVETVKRMGRYPKKAVDQLIECGYLIPLDDACMVGWIRHWSEMNKVTPQKFHSSIYHEQLIALIAERGLSLAEGCSDKTEKSSNSKGPRAPDVNLSLTQVSSVQDSSGKGSVDECKENGSENTQPLYTLGNEVLTKVDYDRLCSRFTKPVVDATVHRIMNKPYYGCLNTHTISDWCIEKTESGNLPPSVAASVGCLSSWAGSQRQDYDFEEIERYILAN